jgi:hypothetical protein
MQEKLEKYLSQVEIHLAELPAKEREAELREVRSHLEMMIKENIARGYDSNNAAEKAFEQFGSAEKIGRALRFAPNSTSKRLRKLVVNQVAFCAFVLLALSIFWLLFSSGTISLRSPLVAWFPYGLGISMFFVFGWFAENIAPKQNTVLTFFLCLFLVCCLAVCGRLLNLSPVWYLQLVFQVFAFAAGVLACRRLSKRRDHSAIIN